MRELPYTDREADGTKVNQPSDCHAQRRQPQTSEHTGCSMVELIRAEAKQTADVERQVQKPWERHHSTASSRSDAPALRSIRRRWFFTVCSERYNRAAISLLVRPSLTN